MLVAFFCIQCSHYWNDASFVKNGAKFKRDKTHFTRQMASVMNLPGHSGSNDKVAACSKKFHNFSIFSTIWFFQTKNIIWGNHCNFLKLYFCPISSTVCQWIQVFISFPDGKGRLYQKEFCSQQKQPFYTHAGSSFKSLGDMSQQQACFRN